MRRKAPPAVALDPLEEALLSRPLWDSREPEPAVLCFGPVQHLSFEMAAGGREMAWLRAQASIAGVSLIFWEGGERPDGIAYQPSNPAEHEYFRAYHDAAHACLAVTHVGP